MNTILAQFGPIVDLPTKLAPQPWHLLLVPVIAMGWALLIWYVVTKYDV